MEKPKWTYEKLTPNQKTRFYSKLLELITDDFSYYMESGFYEDFRPYLIDVPRIGYKGDNWITVINVLDLYRDSKVEAFIDAWKKHEDSLPN